MTEDKPVGIISSRLMEPSVNYSQSQEIYRQWNKDGTYDKLMGVHNDYGALFAVRGAATKYLKDPENMMILDVGAGTGLTGAMMSDIGFKKLHALEPLGEFAEAAKKKGIYSDIILEPIGYERLSINDDTYDGIVTSGAFGPGHIPCDALPEMVRVVKPGGHIIIAMRHEFTWTIEEYKDRLEPLMRTLEEKGQWKQMLREIYPRHFLELDGVLYVFRVC